MVFYTGEEVFHDRLIVVTKGLRGGSGVGDAEVEREERLPGRCEPGGSREEAPEVPGEIQREMIRP